MMIDRDYPNRASRAVLLICKTQQNSAAASPVYLCDAERHFFLDVAGVAAL